MHTRWTWLLLCLTLLSGCTPEARQPAEPPLLVIAATDDLVAYELRGSTYVVTADPIGAVRSGKAAAGLVPGVKPVDLEGFTLTTRETILMQPWLDPPLAFTKAQALEQAPRLGAPGELKPGALAKGSLADLKPGWRPIPVDGVSPTPETVSNGTYPLSGIVSVVYRPEGQPLADQLRASVNLPVPWATLSVAGDYMLARGVARAMRENGLLYPVAKVREHLSAADLTFANLESPLGVKGKPLPGKQIWFRAAPEAIELLKATGVDGVAIANNHILDYDTENFLETLEILEQAGIGYVGGGRNIAEARKPLILEAKGVKVAFLAYSQFADLFFDWNYPRSFNATEKIPGVARIQDDWLAEDIKAARNQADIVAIAFHWGDEFQNYPNPEQKRLAHLSIDLGADLVLGYHPHAIQGFELYKGKFIAYSTGNFIMDRQDTDLARESMILDFQLTPDGVRSAAVHPVWINAEQPYIMTGPAGESLLQKMRTLSGWETK